MRTRGYAFVDVKPRIARDRAKKTVDLVFDVAEGPRVYVERIDIVGNTRTKDKVIRREFRLAEGDAFNAAQVRRVAAAAAGSRLLQQRDGHPVAGLGAGQGDPDRARWTRRRPAS